MEDQARKKEKAKANEANTVRPLTEGLLFTCQFSTFAKLHFSDQLKKLKLKTLPLLL